MKVIFSKSVISYLAELVEVLYMKDYFGFKDSAKKYVDELITEIESNIDKKHPKFAPEYFSKYGQNLYYVSYRRNKNTQCHVFFNYSDEVYYIRYIGNNHNIGQYL